MIKLAKNARNRQRSTLDSGAASNTFSSLSNNIYEDKERIEGRPETSSGLESYASVKFRRNNLV